MATTELGDESHTSWCSTTATSNERYRADSIRKMLDKQLSACAPMGVNPWKKKTISVKLKNTHLLSKWELDKDFIVDNANKWSRGETGNKYIPEFQLTSDDARHYDVLVELNEGNNLSDVGYCARSEHEPNMLLDLSEPRDCYRQHLVVHEFGHLLGLEHEHQRSDFWIRIQPFIDERQMQDELGDRFSDWEKKIDVTTAKCSEYDPDSVMHYWFKKSWLKFGLSDETAVQNNHTLSVKQKEAILGVHKRANGTANVPSKLDLKFLSELYSEAYYRRSVSVSAMEFADGDVQTVTTPPAHGTTPSHGSGPPVVKKIKLGDKPTLGDLESLVYIKEGQRKCVRIINEATADLNAIAAKISNNSNKATVLNMKFPNDPEQQLRQLFIDCFINNPPANNYTQDWAGMIQLLKGVGKSTTLVDKVIDAVSQLE